MELKAKVVYRNSTTEHYVLIESECFKILTSWEKDCLLRGILVISGIHIAAYEIISMRGVILNSNFVTVVSLPVLVQLLLCLSIYDVIWGNFAKQDIFLIAVFFLISLLVC